MKTTNALLFAGAAVLALAPQTYAMEKFLQGLPNGSNFKKSLGHKDDGGYTAFGGMFSGTWSESLCKDKFPGSSITVGQAFGDPCCTWKQGGKPDFEVSFTADFPAQSTKTCAAGGGGSSAGSAGSKAPAASEAPATEAPAATDAPAASEAPATDAPADTPPADTPAVTEAPAATDAPAAPVAPATTPAAAGGSSKAPSAGGNGKGNWKDSFKNGYNDFKKWWSNTWGGITGKNGNGENGGWKLPSFNFGMLKGNSTNNMRGGNKGGNPPAAGGSAGDNTQATRLL